MIDQLFPVTITRSNWHRGKNGIGSALLITEDYAARRGFKDSIGDMCCLGHVSLALGLTKDEIGGITSPIKLIMNDNLSVNNIILPPAMERLIDYAKMDDSQVCKEMMRVNDDTYLEDEYRETRLIELGKEAGLALTFVD